jgi:hypothetical protein
MKINFCYKYYKYNTKFNERIICDLYTIYEDYDIESGLQKKDITQKHKQTHNTVGCFYLTMRVLSTIIISSVFSYILLYSV